MRLRSVEADDVRTTPANIDSSKVKVAIVYASDFSTTSPGGIAGSLEEVVAQLGDRCEFVLVCARGASVGEDATTHVGGHSLRVIPVISAARKFRWIPLNLVFTARLFLYRKMVVQSVNIVHVHRMELAIPFLFRKRRPVVLTIHGSSKHNAHSSTGLLRWRLVRWLYDLVEGVVLARVDRVICVSRDGLTYYRGRFPHLSGKFLQIPNALNWGNLKPVDRSAARRTYGLDDGGVVIVYVGRLAPEKQVGLLVEAFTTFRRDVPGASLLIAGDGPERKAIADLVRRLNVSNVRFLGLVPRHEVRILLTCADVLVLPSRFEGFPMAALEALSVGVPVVASAVGGIKELLADGLREFMLTDVSIAALKEKMLEAVRRRPEIQPLCVLTASRFRSDVVLPSLERVYRSYFKGP